MQEEMTSDQMARDILASLRRYEGQLQRKLRDNAERIAYWEAEVIKREFPRA